jgi:hypothetical protein
MYRTIVLYIMQLTESEKKMVLDLLHIADGEDVNEIIERSLWEAWLTRTLILNAPSKYIKLYLRERYALRKMSNLLPHDV